MSEPRKAVHFIVCAEHRELIETITKLCKEHNIEPLFTYRGKVQYMGANVPMLFRTLESVVTELVVSESDPTKLPREYYQLMQQSADIWTDIFMSKAPVVSCVRVHTSVTELFSAMMSKRFQRQLVIYNEDPKMVEDQKNIFKLPVFEPYRPEYAETPEQIFHYVGEKAMA